MRCPVRLAALALSLVTIGAGCTMYGPGPDRGLVRMRVALNQENFRVARSHVEGHAACRHLLWIPLPDWHVAYGLWDEHPGAPAAIAIALENPHIRERAMADLRSQVDLLGKPRFLHNVVEEWTVSNCLGLFAIVRLTISADVIEFRGDG